MCGIVGYTGTAPVRDILLEGLRKLEYRGYDSAGIAVETNDKIIIVRRVGKVEELAKASKTGTSPRLAVSVTRAGQRTVADRAERASPLGLLGQDRRRA